jgi:Nucleotidyltransferase of unknown function (DUF6036)
MQISRPEQLTQFLTRLGERYPQPAAIYIFGGSAILWLGGQRHTGDIDYTAAPSSTALREAISQTASELDLDLEESSPAEFMPLPAGAETRHEPIGTFGQIQAYLFDPYSMAVMKIDRAFDTDMEDVAFLIAAGRIDLRALERYIEDVATRYDEPIKLRRNLAEFERNLKP